MKEQPTNDKFKARVPWEWTLSDGTHMKGYWENGRPVNYWIFYSSSLKHKTIRKQYIIR